MRANRIKTWDADTDTDGLVSALKSKIFSLTHGRQYGTLLDPHAGGYWPAATDAIEQPAYIIKSILMDELGVPTGNIDHDSFDLVGDPSTGSRKDWKFARALVTKENAPDLLSRLCYESHCLLTETGEGKYRLVALDKDTTTTFVISQNQMSRPPILGRTNAKNIRNAFTIGYNYDYALGGDAVTVVVDEKQSGLLVDVFDPSTFTPMESGLVTTYGGGANSLCGVSQSRFRARRELTESLLWVHDLGTAESWVKKMVEWLYAPKVTLDIAGWWGDPADAVRRPLIQYEIGDQCRVSHPLLLPDVSLTNFFMVVGKEVDKKTQLVSLKLLGMR